MSESKLRPVSKENPCPACGGKDGCSVKADGLILCRRRDNADTTFRCLGPAKGDPQWKLFRAVDDPRTDKRGDTVVLSMLDEQTWPAVFAQQQASMTSSLREELAASLGLPTWAIVSTGWKADERCWTFPECDADRRIVGLNRRFRDGSKRVMPGGKRGLTVLNDYDRGGPIFLVEGASDVLAMRAMGLTVVGRPSCTGGGDQLAHLLCGFPADRRLLVVGENDSKGDGSWPGKDGAALTAAKLAAALGRPVEWALPGGGAKDSRAWASAQDAGADRDAWAQMGKRFVANWCLTRRTGRLSARSTPNRRHRRFPSKHFRHRWAASAEKSRPR